MKPVTILCLDDEKILLDMFKESLEAEGLHVFATSSVTEALSALDTTAPFTFCLCDFQMPEMQGDDFLRLVAVKSPGTTRILMSGCAADNRIQQATSEGVCSLFIQKPFRVPELLSSLDIYCRTRKLHLHPGQSLVNQPG